MTFHRIDEPYWKSFAEAFSRSHEGWTGSLEVGTPGSAPRIDVDESVFAAPRSTCTNCDPAECAV